MRVIIDPKNQKFYVTAIAALVLFFGLQAVSLALDFYQIGAYFQIALAVYVFVGVFQMFVFDLHLKPARTLQTFERSVWQAFRDRFRYLVERKHWLHFQNYLLLPGIIYWSTIGILGLNLFDNMRKQVWISLSTLALATTFWYLKTVFYEHHRSSRMARELIFLCKMYASFVSFSAALGLARYFGYGGMWVGLLVFLLTYLLLYQAFFQHHYVGYQTLKFLLGIGVVMGIGAYTIYELWNINFYSGALVLAAVYNTFWGIVHHKFIDNNLTRKITFEYLSILLLILVIVIGTTNFAQRI